MIRQMMLGGIWAAVVFLLPSVALAKWPGWRGPERNGRSADAGLLREWPEHGPPLAWKVGDIGHGWSNVAVAGGSVYITGDQDEELRLTSLTLDGQQQWQVVHDKAWTGPHPGSRATPTIDGERLYLPSGNGVVGCRSVRDGSLIWERRLQDFGGKVPNWGYSASVLIHKDLAIVVPGSAECVVALDKVTGKKQWATEGYSAGAEYCSPILIAHPEGDFVVAATKSGLLGVDVASGRVLWTNSYSTGGGINAATPLYADGYVFWPNGFTKGAVCLKIERDRSVTQVWQTDEDPECHLGDFVADAGYLYGHHGRAWKCFELATGRELWSSRSLGTGAICYADGMLYLFQERRGIAALATCSPEGLDIHGRAQVEGKGPSWAHPVVAGGRLYLRYGTTLYCFDVSQTNEHRETRNGDGREAGAAAKVSLLRHRLHRARETALEQENEQVLLSLLSASRRLARDWNAVPDAEKLAYVRKCEDQLGLSEADELPAKMLLIYVDGREHHRQENLRFAAKMKEHGHTAKVFAAKDRTHNSLAMRIGTTGDPATREIMHFFRSIFSEETRRDTCPDIGAIEHH